MDLGVAAHGFDEDTAPLLYLSGSSMVVLLSVPQDLCVRTHLPSSSSDQ